MVMVIFFHIFIEKRKLNPGEPLLIPPFRGATDIGMLGVGMFVIVSGYALMISTERQQSLLYFAKKRFLAIFPLFWTAYILTVMSSYLYYGALPHHANPWTLLLSFIGMDGFLRYRIENYYLVGEWFIGMILILYTMFPILKWMILKNTAATIACYLMFSLIVDHYYHDIFKISKWMNPLFQANLLLFGMAWYRLRDKLNILSGSAWVVSISLLGAVGYVLPVIMQSILYPVCLFSVLAFVFNLAYIPTFIKNILLKIAELSFPAFLVHHTIIYYIMPYYKSPNGAYEFIVLSAVIVLISLFFGGLVNRISDSAIRYFKVA